MAIRNQQALHNLISDTLDSNSYGVTFDTELYNAGTNKYYTRDEDGQKHRFVPVMITDVVGEYLNVPNANSTNNQVGISFDIFVDKIGELSDNDVTEFANVGYNATLNAIEEFKASLLAKYFPLGTPYLYMGGEDSHFDVNFNGTYNPKVFYLNFIPYNTDSENIMSLSGLYGDVDKNATHIRFEYSSGNYIQVPYSVNEELNIVIYHNGTDWIMDKNDGSPASVTTAYSTLVTGNIDVGLTTGFEGLVKRVSADSTQITSFDFTDIDTELAGFIIDFKEWDSKTTPNNSGSLVLIDTSIINNSILWSEDGNAIFGFGTLNPVNNIRVIDGSYYYQAFELEATVFISNDVLFGNNFEYYLDGEEVFPIDRQHTLGTELGSAQYINGNYNTHIIEESSREHTLSFYYIPSKKLNSLLKHIVSGSVAQNNTYELIVQYPFFKVTYDVVLESGGTQPNINTLSTFTVALKRKDESLT
jgi:hypothetical protein